MPIYTFFTIPFELVPSDPPYRVWFASWSRTVPELKTNEPRPFVVGATRGELPQSATVLGTGLKDRPEEEAPPPPPAVPTTLSEYGAALNAWLSRGTDTQPCAYFAIPYADVRTPRTYTAWFATWTEQRPEIAPGMLPPLVIGLATTELPPGAVVLANGATGLPPGAAELASGGGGKDPPPPPPAAPEPGTSLAAHSEWMKADLDVRWA